MKAKVGAQLFDEYYSRQIVLKEFGKKGQKKLACSKAAVIGIGGLGTVSSLYLALAGVGYLRLIDQDVVEAANLHRQILYTPKDVRYPKVEVAGRRLTEANPSVRVEPVSENLNKNNVEKLLSGMDCVVDGLDNMQTRYLVNSACVKLKIPYVFGAAIGMEGNLSVFSPPETPCLECILPGVKDDYLLTCDTRGVLGATPGIVGSLQAMETVKVLTGLGSPLKGKLMICDFADMYFSTIDILRRSDCPTCHERATPSASKEALAWLCGKNTANINPQKPMKKSLKEAYEVVKNEFKVRIKSKFAIIFDFRGFEVTLFNGGRMLVKNVKDEKTAMRVYGQVRKKLDMG